MMKILQHIKNYLSVILIKFQRVFLKIFGKVLPTDIFSYRHPVSVKGICFIDNKVILLRNERGAWDLPGGKLSREEDIKICLAREMKEELDIEVTVDKLLEVDQIKVMDMVGVIILIYLCSTDAKRVDIKLSFEHYGLGLYTLEEMDLLNMSGNYKTIIRMAQEQMAMA